MTQLLPNIFAQLLHPSEYRGEIIEGKLYLYHKAQLSDDVRSIVDLPSGSYEILFTTKDCNEDDASSVRNAVVDAHFDTELQEWRYGFHENNTMFYETATDALHSLLKSKGLTAENYLIIKKVEG